MSSNHRIGRRSRIRTTLKGFAALAVMAATGYLSPLSPVVSGPLAHADEPVAWSQAGADLRFEATFQQGEARADRAIGDNRMSRVMWARDYNRFPWDGTRGRVSLPQSILPAPFDLFDRGYVYEPRTDASFRLPGHLNAQAGTFSVWVRRSDLFDQGGSLFEGKTMLAGAARSSTHWLLAIGNEQLATAPKGHLYLATDDVGVVADKPMAELTQDEWVHVAAVWDAEAGAALYVGGQLVGQSWQNAQPVEEPEPVYQAARHGDPLHQWRISRGTQSRRAWTSLTQAESDAQGDGVTVSHHAADSDQPARWVVQTRSHDRLQLRSPTISALTPGRYRVAIRYRQQLEATDQAVRGLNVRLIVRWDDQAEPTYVSASSQATSHDDWRLLETSFQVPDNAADVAGSMDLQIHQPGRYEVAEVAIFPAAADDPAPANLLAGHGRGWHRSNPRVIPTPVQRLHIHPQPAPAAITNIRIYDAPLTDQAVASLANPRLRGPINVTYRPHQPNMDWRQKMLDWDEAESGWIPLEPGQPVQVEQAVVQAAYEDKRAAGWLAVDGWGSTSFPWWYHGYSQLSQRRLHVVFDQPARVNYVVARGTLAGQLHAGGRPDVPEGDSLLNLPGTQPVGRFHFDEPVTLESLTVVRDGGQLLELGAYHIDQSPSQGRGAAALHLYGNDQALPLSDHKQAEMLSSYRAEDRSYLVGQDQPGQRAETRVITPLQAVHLFSPRMAEDYPLDAVRLRLHTQGLKAASRVHVRVHDSFDPWRELGRFDFQLQADTHASQPLDITLKLRPTLIRRGDAVWVTLYFESAGELVYLPGQAPSSLILHRGDEQQAESLWLKWALVGWRTAFETLSEPRVWNRGIASPEDGWWLQITSPEYEQMVHVGQELMARYPDEPRVRAWFNYIHPSMPNPAADLPLPQPQGHPRWAELARANLKLYHHFTAWWTVNRAHENGELGHFWGDDTDLMQEWPDMAMIHDPDGKLRHAVLNLADGIWNRFQTRGLPVIRHGVNSRWTDALHAYEDGLNIAPMSLLLDYGNPILFERLLETTSRYADGHLLKRLDENQVRFSSQGTGLPYWDYQKPAKGDPHHHWWFLMTHPGLMVLWYNGHPGVHRLFNDLANWKLDAWDPDQPFRVDVPNTFFTGMYLHTGDARYLTTVLDPQARQQLGIITQHPAASHFDGSLIRRLDPADYSAEQTLTASRENAHQRFDDLGTRNLGYTERRFERNWVEWYLSGDKQYLEEGLAALYRRLAFTMPAITEAEQSGDRVAPPRHLISQMYLGGVVQTRNNHFYPDFALSYEGLSLDFAALVTRNSAKDLSVVLYNFENDPQLGQLRVWQLEPGRYHVRYGLDTNGDDQIDQVLDQRTLELQRADRVPVTLPSHQLLVVEITQATADPVPLHARPDLAMHPDRAIWQADGSLAVRVDNIGSVPAQQVAVHLVDPQGRTLVSQTIERIGAPLDYQPAYGLATFTAQQVQGASSLRVQVDPHHAIKEIYRGNNIIEVPRRP